MSDTGLRSALTEWSKRPVTESFDGYEAAMADVRAILDAHPAPASPGLARDETREFVYAVVTILERRAASLEADMKQIRSLRLALLSDEESGDE